jgi:uncharacterized protein YqgC (DUF456 family)
MDSVPDRRIRITIIARLVLMAAAGIASVAMVARQSAERLGTVADEIGTLIGQFRY